MNKPEDRDRPAYNVKSPKEPSPLPAKSRPVWLPYNNGFILANELNCRLYFFAAVYAVTLNNCLRQLLSVTSTIR